MNKPNKLRKANSISAFDFSTLYIELSQNKLLMVLKKLIDFRFDGGEDKYIVVCSYGVSWIKDTKDNQICLNKQQIKDAVADLLLNCYLTVGHKNFCQIISILMGSDAASFFANLFLHFYESKWMNEIKKSDLIKTRKLSNIFYVY